MNNYLAAQQGFEPQLLRSERSVLPLDDRANLVHRLEYTVTSEVTVAPLYHPSRLFARW